ncbi:MAG: bifunctional riboflavin kinase/FAD synthetase [Clostridiales bacterium]|nr:bifunctional riboflavin kinase/FAD synthetase [Clostridiales bacterium]
MQKKRGAVVALGMFDGMHIGHRTLLMRAVERALEINAVSMAHSFINHPRSVFANAPGLLMTAREREACMRALGVNDVVMEDFTRPIAALSPRAFVERMRESFSMRVVAVGFNYTFGHKGEGTPQTLCALGAEYGFAVEVIAPVEAGGAPVSSTRVRELIENGRMREANAMLINPYALSGTVRPNRRIGATLGFPTANILPPEEKVLPRAGVYVSRITCGAETYRAVTNVGDNPTVNGQFITVESHLIGFDGDLYGKRITVEFLDFIRPERRFLDKAALKGQIARDTAHAKSWEANSG